MGLNQFLYCFKENVNRAYKKLATILHPNKNVAPGSAEAFKLLVKARTALTIWYISHFLKNSSVKNSI